MRNCRTENSRRCRSFYSSVVIFINILLANFLYESALQSISLVLALIFFGSKRMRKMLMKLTPVRISHGTM